MQNYRNGKWVDQILSQRREDGLWGNFHTLSCPVPGRNYTTEQAIRRLYYLGYTAEDEVIQRVLSRMEQCIKGELDIDNYSEKKHDWVFFEKLMLAAWLRIFEPQNETALEVACQWAQVVEKAFSSGSYSVADDVAAFTEWKGRKPKSGFETGFGMFYHAALLPGVLSPKTEDLFLDYYLSKPDGMYYIYDKPLNQLPETFASRKSSCYIAAIEVLSRYDLAKEKLTFVMDWINANRNENGQWDFGEKAKDGVYFPLSDRWDKTTRITDSTYRISKLFGLPCYCGHDCSKCVSYIATQTHKMIDYTYINSETWDSWAEDGCEYTLPISHEEYEKITPDNYSVFLTPCIAVPHEWFGDLKGKKVLGLASGGGQQMPVLSKLGAECTVFDYSDRQLEAEKMVSEREGCNITIIKGDMSKTLPFEDESFDLIFHPVSNNYVEDVYHVWNECYRVLIKGGRLLSGLDNGIDYLFEENDPLKVVNPLPFNPLKMPKERLEKMIANGDGVQFSHTLDEQIGGQLKAGFTLKALYEDRDGEGGNIVGEYYPQYVATFAVK